MKKLISTVLALGMAASLAACGGSGAWRSSTDVPKSTRLPENTPFDTSTSASLPRNVTCSVLRTSFDCGSAAKYCSACAMLSPCKRSSSGIRAVIASTWRKR